MNIPGSVLFQLLAGFLEAGPGINEVSLVSTEPGGDPALFRVGGVTAAGGGIAGDVFVSEPDPGTGIRRREMVVLIQYKKDERTRGRDDVLYGELTGHILGPKSERYPDGMMPFFVALHDYVWVKGLSSTPEPVKPWLELPPPSAPAPQPPPTGPKGDPFTAGERLRFVAALSDEFGFPPDEQSSSRYITQGHSPSFKELHDDMLPRNDGAHDVSRHHPEAPY